MGLTTRSLPDLSNMFINHLQNRMILQVKQPWSFLRAQVQLLSAMGFEKTACFQALEVTRNQKKQGREKELGKTFKVCLKQLWFTWKLSLDVVFECGLFGSYYCFLTKTSPKFQDRNMFLGPGIIQPSWSVFKSLSQVCDSSSLFETKCLSDKNSADSPYQPVKVGILLLI